MRICSHFVTVVLLTLMFLVLACVKTEKRTTKKVDVNDMHTYQADMAQPRIRLALNIPAEVKPDIPEMLYIEIDDGSKRYAFGGNVYTSDSTDSSGQVYSPWINTPDSGLLIFAFKLAYDSVMIAISDMMTMPLEPEWYWQVELGVAESDPCPAMEGVELCRSYALPRDIVASGDGQLFLAWRRSQLGNPLQN
ncbi:MAG: hypothetical protein JSU74_04815 [Candidatus Zixiibacteriota bacterium]|nr:MAG: hypothetical protein JSU74_04815 [candidate division Zixibacteria bacterium]